MLLVVLGHTWASPKVQGGPFELFRAMGGFLGGEGRLFGTFQGGDRPPLCPRMIVISLVVLVSLEL